MQQTLFYGQKETERTEQKVINIASIPQRSPFRYPGGKTWFVPTLRKWLKRMREKPKLLIEPFAGGGIISLTAVFERLTENALMVELDEQVAAVWETIIEGNTDWLIKQILTFDLTDENLSLELGKRYSDLKHVAFQTILKNRTYHGGILAKGSGIIKYGENGKGLLSRWYPMTLARRIRNIDLMKDKLMFMRSDGIEIMHSYAPKKDVVYFIDPPYTAGGKRAGERLYKYFDVDHEQLFKLCGTLKGDFVLTYDNSNEVKELAGKNNFETREVSMKNTHHDKMTELVIGRDLSWMDFVC